MLRERNGIMKFKKEISMELRGLLMADFEQYTSEVQMSEEEYVELCKWVQEGNSPYDNGWYMSSNDGHPMWFVETMREIIGIYAEK